MIGPVFPADRWRRAGATGDEIEALEARFAALPPVAAAGEAGRIASESDRMLAEHLEAWRSARTVGAADGPETAGAVDTVRGDGEAGSGAETDAEGSLDADGG